METRVRELASLQTELNKHKAITQRALSEWALESDDRSVLLWGGVWGGIRWSKGLGRPLTPSIMDGFTIVHEWFKHKFVDAGGGGLVETGKFLVQPPPSVWDATTADEYRVGFFFFAGLGGLNPNKLTVKLAPVPWEKVRQMHVRAGYRQLDPQLGYAPFGSLGKPRVIPDYVVRHVPYRSGTYMQPLEPRRELP
jgi:hypothetical protein